MTRNARFYIKLGVGIILGCALILYAFYQSRDFREGPLVTITEPKNGETITSSPLFIKGIAKNISSITLNDRHITVDEQGHFSEKIYPLAGYNIYKIEVSDKFKRTVRKLIEIVYTGEISNTASTSNIVIQ